MNRLRLLLCLLTSLLILPACSSEEDYTTSATENFDALWRIMDRQYAFFDLKLDKGKSWQDIYNEYRPHIAPRMSSDELFKVMTGMLSELKDGHVNLIAPFDYGRYWAWRTDYPRNFSFDLMEEYLGKEYRIAGGLYYTQLLHHGHTPDSIGYIRYGSFSSPLGEGNINAALKRLSRCRALIIDIRDNGGGNVTTSDRLTRHFMDQPRLVGRTRHKTGPGHNDFSPLVDIHLETLTVGVKWLRPVVLLTNRGVYSAANDFVLKMKGLPLVTVMGDRTGGGGGLPMTSELPNGWAVRFSSTQTYDAEGNNIELGIDPDYLVAMNQADLRRGYDTIIERAVSYLKERLEEYRRTKVWRK